MDLDERYVIALKRRDVCCRCARDLPSGFRAAWDPFARTITCLECAGPEVIVNVHAPAGPGPRSRAREQPQHIGLWDKIKGSASKPSSRRDPSQRDKQAGAREYEARHQERRASRLDAAGDAEGAAAAREAAEAARKPPPRVPRPKR